MARFTPTKEHAARRPCWGTPWQVDNIGTSQMIRQRLFSSRERRSAVALLFVLWAPTLASAQACPNGTNIIGVVSQAASFDGGAFDFTVTSTQNGATSTQVFFIVDSNSSVMSIRMANVLSAAAQQKQVNIWTYGTSYSYGRQVGWLSEPEFVNY